MQCENQVIIEIDQDSTIVSKKADAVLMVVNESGKEMTGSMKYWLDISQVIEMMAMCKSITSETLLDFETESAHIYVISETGIKQLLPKVLQLCKQSDVQSINVPALPDIETEVWGIDCDDEIVIRICGK